VFADRMPRRIFKRQNTKKRLQKNTYGKDETSRQNFTSKTRRKQTIIEKKLHMAE
jgi:hypothetical protein